MILYQYTNVYKYQQIIIVMRFNLRRIQKSLHARIFTLHPPDTNGCRLNLSFPFAYFLIILSILIGSPEKKMIIDSPNTPAILRFVKRRGNLINKRRQQQKTLSDVIQLSITRNRTLRETSLR